MSSGEVSADDNQTDRDMVEVRIEIANANTEILNYSGGLILEELKLRQIILKNTLTMLEQKRLAGINGITIIYKDSMPRISTSDVNAEAELKRAFDEAEAARREASRYSGGLIQTMALMREATARVTVAAIQQRMALARSGIPLPASTLDSRTAQPAPGKPTSDKDAL